MSDLAPCDPLSPFVQLCVHISEPAGRFCFSPFLFSQAPLFFFFCCIICTIRHFFSRKIELYFFWDNSKMHCFSPYVSGFPLVPNKNRVKVSKKSAFWLAYVAFFCPNFSKFFWDIGTGLFSAIFRGLLRQQPTKKENLLRQISIFCTN